jgi:hypothetical protein
VDISLRDWAVLHQNAPVALRDLEGFPDRDLP